MHDATLYQNEGQSVTLLDIPRSLEQGQSSTGLLRSLLPSELPYLSTEPKGVKRQRLLDSIQQNEIDYHRDLRELVSIAFQTILSEYQGDWYLPRVGLIDDEPWESFMAAAEPTVCHKQSLSPPMILSPDGTAVSKSSDLTNTVICNPSTVSVRLSAGNNAFHIPPHSVLLCASIEQGFDLVDASIRLLLPVSASTSQHIHFDLILLDPPWSNRSVRRGRLYSTVENQESSPFEQTLPIIQEHLSEHGHVAVWITNKTAVRRDVMKAFERLNLQLHEEWIWMKVTTKGEPITTLDGLWRKPYEALLIFRRGASPSPKQQRVIFAVPDVHSRKPCLKQLFEPLLPRPYHALEIFARNLTAGWWSWGVEALKYQHESYWTDFR